MGNSVGIIVSIFMGIISLFSGFMFFQLRAIDKRIQDEKKDREDSIKERRDDIKEIFGKIETVNKIVGQLGGEVHSQQVLCNERHSG